METAGPAKVPVGMSSPFRVPLEVVREDVREDVLGCKAPVTSIMSDVIAVTTQCRAHCR